jgi:hypothetical protein
MGHVDLPAASPMEAGIAVGNKPLDAKLAHVAERHRRAGGVLGGAGQALYAASMRALVIAAQ